ncbi:hypothetical protein JNUCC23_09615 [Peribacillus sp. JNUCC 23]
MDELNKPKKKTKDKKFYVRSVTFLNQFTIKDYIRKEAQIILEKYK